MQRNKEIITFSDRRHITYAEFRDPGERLIVLFHGQPGACFSAILMKPLKNRLVYA